MRVVANFLAAKYSLSLVAAAVATAFVPPGLGAIRFIFAAIVLMPVPSVCVQYAAEHDADAVLAGCLANYSQVVSLVFLCALGALSAAHDPTAANRLLMPACLAGGAVAVAGLGFAADKALAPVKMVFRGSVPGGAKEQAAKISKKMEISKPDPGGDGPAGSNGPTVASAAGAGMRRGSSVTGLPRRVPRINTDRGWNQGGGGSIRGWNQTVAKTSSRARPNVARASGPTALKSTGVRVSAVPRPCFAFA
tara:strand:- start:1107 stop:1856 length:750 start_codon:yes stop_codon:yes gene_type:complete